MEKIWKAVSKYFFFAFIAALLLWAANMTVHAVATALPGDKLSPILALALFDGGALAWLGAFLFVARGTHQRATALIMTIVDVIGVIFMTAGGLTVVSPALVRIGMVVATAASYGALYFFHASSPEAQKAMAAQSLEDELQEEALRQATAHIKQEARRLGAVLARRVSGEIKYNLHLPMSKKELKEWQEGEYVDVPAEEIPALPDPDASRRLSFWDGVLNFFGLRQAANSEFTSMSSTTSGRSPEEMENE
ncbi:MAG: hypothetical protein JW963_08975 [Anaerolineales bacterium]|nr:hypothetical protein [Anaerolineales bacterium]